MDRLDCPHKDMILAVRSQVSKFLLETLAVSRAGKGIVQVHHEHIGVARGCPVPPLHSPFAPTAGQPQLVA